MALIRELYAPSPTLSSSRTLNAEKGTKDLPVGCEAWARKNSMVPGLPPIHSEPAATEV